MKEKHLDVFTCAIMSSHLHIVCSVKDPGNLSDVVMNMKKLASKQLVTNLDETRESRKK